MNFYRQHSTVSHNDKNDKKPTQNTSFMDENRNKQTKNLPCHLHLMLFQILGAIIVLALWNTGSMTKITASM